MRTLGQRFIPPPVPWPHPFACVLDDALQPSAAELLNQPYSLMQHCDVSSQPDDELADTFWGYAHLGCDVSARRQACPRLVIAEDLWLTDPSETRQLWNELESGTHETPRDILGTSMDKWMVQAPALACDSLPPSSTNTSFTRAGSDTTSWHTVGQVTHSQCNAQEEAPAKQSKRRTTPNKGVS